VFWTAVSILISALNADGNRLNLGDFDADGLNCNNWNWNDDKRNPNIGCFPLMVCKE